MSTTVERKGYGFAYDLNPERFHELVTCISMPFVGCGNLIPVKDGDLLLIRKKEEELRTTTCEDFGIDQNDVELELSYLPMELISTIDCPPVIIGNDRQVKNFLTYVRGKASSRLCVSISPLNANNDNIELDKEQSNASGRDRREPPSVSPRDDIGSSSQSSKDGEDECNLNALKENEDADLSGKEEDRGKSVRFTLKHVVKTGETFQNKSKLKAALEMSAQQAGYETQKRLNEQMMEMMKRMYPNETFPNIQDP
ncbi:hypothetical protein IGI04_015758 [Brassica rapa subsp. trilocularis]|uniref:Uncharacterized protein n=1 Tax=Brassica rapa subsp. trilocularis TaxID=1813537 RepID=A0ABQ7MTZ1_BRACM|nr:hypothetical protein IGI04_015758 [Brassica rapa subsp. trilocularis]